MCGFGHFLSDHDGLFIVGGLVVGILLPVLLSMSGPDGPTP